MTLKLDWRSERLDWRDIEAGQIASYYGLPKNPKKHKQAAYLIEVRLEKKRYVMEVRVGTTAVMVKLKADQVGRKHILPLAEAIIQDELQRLLNYFKDVPEQSLQAGVH